MTYTPPPGDKVALNFGAAHTVPAGDKVALEFAPEAWVVVAQYVVTHGHYGGGVSGPAVRNTHEYLAPPGFDAQAHGQSSIWNQNQLVLAGGITSKLAWGKPTVYNRDRYLSGKGWASQHFGTALLQGGVRQILVNGVPAPTLSQKPWLSFSPRWLEPSAVEAPNLPVHLVGGLRYLEPEGFEATRWGARVVPESQTVYPLGLDGTLWGDAQPWNHTTRVHPTAIKWQAEEVRFGMAHSWNWQQHVAQYYETEHVDAFGIWTSVENRNRVITHHSTAPGALPTPSIDNAARPLLPSGIAAPSEPEYYKAGMVAYRVREYTLEGIDPPGVSRWMSVHNGARVLASAGFVATGFGDNKPANNRRYFPWITGGDQQAFGAPMVADRIRTLSFESRYGIAPPSIPLPEAKLRTRYIEPSGYESLRMGGHYLHIHWTIITPRWTHTELSGYGRVHNVTPEVRTHGRNSEEFGDTAIRTQWRRIETNETFTQRFGLAKIADRKQTILAEPAFAPKQADKHKVQNQIPDLPPQQYISHTSAYGYDLEADDKHPVPTDDHGFGVPICGAQSIRPAGIEADGFDIIGKPTVLYLGINDATVGPEEGIGFPGIPWVSARIRSVVIVTTDDVVGGVPAPAFDSKPRLSPHTIYAVVEAPEQAIRNHAVPGQMLLHWVDYLPHSGEWKKGVGRPGVSHYHRLVKPSGDNLVGGNHLGTMSWYGTPDVRNKDVRVSPDGIKPPQVPRPVLQGFSRTITVSNRVTDTYAESSFGPFFGTAWVSNSLRFIAPGGIASKAAAGNPTLDFYHRWLKPSGFSALGMGGPGGGPRFMRQRLHVGAPDWPTIEGFNAELFGSQWVSNRIRGVEAQGFEATRIGDEFDTFHLRMRVKGTDPRPIVPAQQAVSVPGFNSFTSTSAGNVSNWVQYIRPDGNMDNFRKGAPT